MLVIDHLAVVHQGLDACMTRSWGSSPSLATISSNFTKVHMGIDVVCHSLLDTVEEGRSFGLCCLSVPLCCRLASIVHASARDLVPRAAKTYLRWSSLSGRMQLRRSQFSRVQQNMEKEWYASWEFQS